MRQIRRKNSEKINKKNTGIRSFQTVRGRMTFGYIFLFLVIVIPMSIVIYSFITRALTEKNEEAHGKILNAAEEVLEDKLDIYQENARLIMSNETVQNTLEMKEEEPGLFMNLRRSTLLQIVGRSFTNSISDLSGIYLFDNQGKLFYQDQNVSSYEVETALSHMDMEAFDWYQKALEAKGKELFFGEDILFGAENLFSCVKVVNRLNSTEKIGLMVLRIRKETLKSVVGLFPLDKDGYILKEGNHIVCRNGYEDKLSGEDMLTVLEGADKNYVVTRHDCEKSGWELYHIVERQYLFSDAGMVRSIILGFSALAVVLMVFLSVWQAYRITKPLYELKENIYAVGQGERAFHNRFQNDEIGAIGREFQKMVTEKLELKERITQEELLRKDSELQLLQSQINPHFLYNTLETLYWMALDKEADEVADLTQALSEIFKISLNNGEEFISVRDEIRFIEDYLHIQNVRFEGKFLVRIQVEEAVEDWLIMKQILQPFVENAIYHGLEPKMEKGNLIVTGSLEEDFLVFTITDDGVGISPDVDVTGGYAVSNVMQRVKLHYGESAEVVFDSEPGRGTTVRILLPVQEVRNAKGCIG